MRILLGVPATLLRGLGRAASATARHAGGLGLLAWRIARSTLSGGAAFRDVMARAFLMGVPSVPLVAGPVLDGGGPYWHRRYLFYEIIKGLALAIPIPRCAVHLPFLTRGGAVGVGRTSPASVGIMIIAMLDVDVLGPHLFLN